KPHPQALPDRDQLPLADATLLDPNRDHLLVNPFAEIDDRPRGEVRHLGQRGIPLCQLKAQVDGDLAELRLLERPWVRISAHHAHFSSGPELDQLQLSAAQGHSPRETARRTDTQPT